MANRPGSRTRRTVMSVLALMMTVVACPYEARHHNSLAVLHRCFSFALDVLTKRAKAPACARCKKCKGRQPRLPFRRRLRARA